MLFQVGEYITGILGNLYDLTSSDALMRVTETAMTDNANDIISVRVVAHNNEDCVNHTFSVKQGEFELCTPEGFFAQNPDCQYISGELVNRQSAQQSTETKEVHTINDKARNKLNVSITSLLNKYDYPTSDKGVNKIVDTWYQNKYPLIELFSKHPKYNGKYQIVDEHTYSRQLDKSVMLNFACWISAAFSDIFEEYTLHGWTYKELKEYAYNSLLLYRSFLDVPNPYDIIYRGLPFSHYVKEKVKFDKYFTTAQINAIEYNGKYYDQKFSKQISQVRRLYVILAGDWCDDPITTFLTDEQAQEINNVFESANCVEGQKTSRAINKCLTILGYDKHPDYQKEFAKFSDAVNPKKVKRRTVISVHPIDYYTMSFGNSWASCHTIDKQNLRDMPNCYYGQYSSGTESYMLDGVSFVLYTVDEDCDDNKLELQPKINRCMFHYKQGKLIQGRVYPQTNDSGAQQLYEEIRTIAQKIIAKCLGVSNVWETRPHSFIRKCVTTIGTHYPDYGYFVTTNISFLNHRFDDSKRIGDKKIIIGHNPICPNCGEEHTRSENICCNDCVDDSDDDDL